MKKQIKPKAVVKVVVEDLSAYNCPDCEGTGLKDERTRCLKCEGKGKIE